VAQTTTVHAYNLREFSNPSGGGAALVEIHTAGLVSQDATGNPEPRLASRLPKLEDGTIVALPDGRMETTWKMRPNVQWHDGAPFTADDIVFSLDVARRLDILSSTAAPIRQVDSVRASDPMTVVVTWKTTFYRALDLTYRTLWPYPKHILGDALEADPERFEALPYFSTDYVHLGPFRLVEFGQGDMQVFERFDSYFLGRSKVDKIIIRTISDPNAVLANLKAGAIDMASESTLAANAAVSLRTEWQESGAGSVFDRQDNWRALWVQFDPQWVRPVELSQDARIRRGLLLGYDRYAISEFLFPGFPNSRSDGFVLSRDPRSASVGQTFEPFKYDQAQALRTLTEAGWSRAPDGRLLGRDGHPVQIQIRSGGPQYTQEVALIADFWRQLGIDPEQFVESPAQARDNESQAKFPGVYGNARGTGDGVFVNLDSRLQSTAETRWSGANIAHYSNSALDRFNDRLQGTINREAQGPILKEMADILASDLPVMPLYFRIAFAVTTNGVRALDDYAAMSDQGFMARSAHLWDKG
jgi:peptide/nickel transport system substrate-binding protein